METTISHKLTKLLDQLVSNQQTPGLQYLVLKDNAVLFEQNLGTASFETSTLVTSESLFNACSITKVFTSLAIMQLAEAGNIQLTDSISLYVPEYSLQSDIKISHLLSHLSGLPNPIPLRWVHLQEEDDTFDPDDFIKEIFAKYSKLRHTPGEVFAYSNLNYLLLGKIIEKVSGQPYADYIRQKIIDRMGLGKTNMDLILKNDTHYATAYQKKFSFINLILGFLLDRKKLMTPSTNSRWTRFRNYYINGSSYGGLIANATSLAGFASELMKPGSVLLSDQWKKTLFTKQRTTGGKEIDMCLGWFTGNLNGNHYFTHAGAGGGYYCELRIYPEHNMISVIMFNRSGTRDERFLDKTDHFFLGKGSSASG